MLTNPVVISVFVMTILCLMKMNVILSLIISGLIGGLLAGIPLSEVMSILIGGMGGNAETALSYILLGALAVAVNKTGLATILSKKIASAISGRGKILVFIIAFISCFSQNVIPVHIAFIPILIPPLLGVMNKLKIDRRAVACALTFGLKTPYIALPIGFGLIFHGIIADEMTNNGMAIAKTAVWKGMWMPGLGMLVGLLIAVLITYRKPRTYEDISAADEAAATMEKEIVFGKNHFVALIGAVAALVIQLTIGSLPLGALVGLVIMIAGGAIKWSEMDDMMSGGIKMMGFIAFVMLVAAGYGSVIRETGGVDSLVTSTASIIGGSKLLGAVVMILIGLFITMGIGTSFGTIPIIATIYVPLCLKLNFSPLATAILIGTAAALGDAGSPASDSTLGPTSGLSVDGQHDHIWDTCVPTFLHFNIPLVIFGVIGALML
ncbi:Na+/H+ antiporter family protein [Anaeromicrobium sediminis]|uniref:Sodium:proton antiporter n=1 Tax=Anaeromicrobium sediminis TaxID=1478221 RepID=A0A267MLE5_9FIRM|nr:Na+/H+ antiporter family protein [Anaeromicrobium sediminis]PAB59705.1 sodium:proton antiporter [Anaeromicrobium sediminis]